jgi:hypothetical protein
MSQDDDDKDIAKLTIPVRLFRCCQTEYLRIRESQRLLQIKPILEEFTCPVCFEFVDDCYMTPCGYEESFSAWLIVCVSGPERLAVTYFARAALGNA